MFILCPFLIDYNFHPQFYINADACQVRFLLRRGWVWLFDAGILFGFSIFYVDAGGRFGYIAELRVSGKKT